MAYAKIEVYAPTEKPIKQESIWSGPLDISRTQTDFKFIVALAICFAIWIIVGIYAICAGNRDVVLYSNTLGHIEMYRMLNLIYEGFDHSKYYILVMSLISVTTMTIYMLMFRWITRFLVGLTMVLLLAFIGLLYYISIYFIVRWDSGYGLLIFTITLSVFYILTCIAFIKAGMNMVCKLMRQTCKAIFFFPSTIFVMVAQFVVQLLLACFGGAAFVFLETIKVQTEEEAMNTTLSIPKEMNEDNETVSEHDMLLFYGYFPFDLHHLGYVPCYVYLLHLINFVGYFWSCCFVMGLGRMILCATFATWYHAEDKSTISIKTMPKCFMAILNYHTGTIAFAASPLSIFFVLYVIYRQGLEKLKGMYKRPLHILSWLLMVIKLPFDALAVSAIHGKEFYDSVKDSYNLLMKNPIAFLAVDTLTETIIFFGTLVTPIVTLFGSTLYFFLLNDRSLRGIDETTTLVVFLFSFLMSLTLFMVFRAASNTIRFCYLEDSKFSHESEMNLYQMYADDKDADY